MSLRMCQPVISRMIRSFKIPAPAYKPRPYMPPVPIKRAGFMQRIASAARRMIKKILQNH